ncbi:hypothetical protein [Prescottella agglutinans]|uniref:Uncharacterized protein n=1 Tax=Prescottella agglutinans TaxID=1644129 RepID=A0ABT6MIR3_9NOCA|nr:hypothetical protein [Prescottella agglutinans]MDH6283224.1 hypothetical protein [Prescottella agglutinans]
MGQFISRDDLEPFAEIDPVKAEAMIEDAEGLALAHAPGIAAVDFPHRSAVRAILREAILRRHDAGSGAIVSQTETRGSMSMSQTVDTSQPRKPILWPSEIQALKDLCKTGKSKAFSIDTAPQGRFGLHDEICSLVFGATYCSCGVDLTGDHPLWGS